MPATQGCLRIPDSPASLEKGKKEKKKTKKKSWKKKKKTMENENSGCQVDQIGGMAEEG